MYNRKLQLHFTGIGGSGMSGLAEILLAWGFAVSGSDLKRSKVVDRLCQLGAIISIGHAGDNLPNATSALVYSSAVTPDNPEVIEAKRRNIPVVRRAEVLAELMRLKFGVAVAGSHGKTTTTSMIAHILGFCGLDPTVVIGGQLQSSVQTTHYSSFDGGGRLGQSEYLVAESDESDRSFLLLKPTIAVVTNIDTEHLSAYDSLADLEHSFEKFVSSVPFYGLAVLCTDDARVRRLSDRCTARKVTYGLTPDSDFRACNIKLSRNGTDFEVWKSEGILGRFELPLIGEHLAINCLAAIAVACEFGLEAPQINKALKSFPGVKRRLEVCGELYGAIIISDYGHHPTEVRATLRAVKQAWGVELNKLKVVFQPHRYSRTRDCFADFMHAFIDADELHILEVYSAGEETIQGFDGSSLTAALEHSNKYFDTDPQTLLSNLALKCEAGDVILFLGAGSIGALPEQLIEYGVDSAKVVGI